MCCAQKKKEKEKEKGSTALSVGFPDGASGKDPKGGDLRAWTPSLACSMLAMLGHLFRGLWNLLSAYGNNLPAEG